MSNQINDFFLERKKGSKNPIIYFFDKTYYKPRSDYKSVKWCPINNNIWSEPDFLELNTKEKLVLIHIKSICSASNSNGFGFSNIKSLVNLTGVARDLPLILQKLEEKQHILIVSRTEYEQKTFANEMKLNEIKENKTNLSFVSEFKSRFDPHYSDLRKCFDKIPPKVKEIIELGSFESAYSHALDESNGIREEQFKNEVWADYEDDTSNVGINQEFCFAYFRVFLSNKKAFDFFVECYTQMIKKQGEKTWNPVTQKSNFPSFQNFLKSAWYDFASDKNGNYPKSFGTFRESIPGIRDNIIYHISHKKRSHINYLHSVKSESSKISATLPGSEGPCSQPDDVKAQLNEIFPNLGNVK